MVEQQRDRMKYLSAFEKKKLLIIYNVYYMKKNHKHENAIMRMSTEMISFQA